MVPESKGGTLFIGDLVGWLGSLFWCRSYVVFNHVLKSLNIKSLKYDICFRKTLVDSKIVWLQRIKDKSFAENYQFKLYVNEETDVMCKPMSRGLTIFCTLTNFDAGFQLEYRNLASQVTVDQWPKIWLELCSWLILRGLERQDAICCRSRFLFLVQYR